MALSTQGNDEPVAGPRGARSLLIIDSNRTLDSGTYGPVWVKDDAVLTIESTKYPNIEGKLNVTDNGSVIIKGELTVWEVTAHCKSFKIDGGELICKNGEPYDKTGVESRVIIHTRKGIEISDMGEIICQGKPGQQSDEPDTKASYDGGVGLIDLTSDSYISITDGSVIECRGGAGGTGVEGDINKGGDGANGVITLQANGTNSSSKISILISDSTVSTSGGAGGDSSISPSGLAEGGVGGNGKLNIISKSNDKIKIEKSTIKATGGSGGGSSAGGMPGAQGNGDIDISCNILYADAYKVDGKGNDEAEWFDGLTIIHADGFTPYIGIDAPEGAYLYVPDLKPLGKDPIIPTATTPKTNIYIYYTLTVTVQDISGTKLEGVTVTAVSGSGTESGTTSDGMCRLLLLAYSITKNNNGRQDWRVSAGLSGATAELPDDVVLENMHNYETIQLTLISIEIDTIRYKERDYEPVDGMIVYDTVTIIGNTSTFQGNTINVKVQVGSADEVLAKDISAAKDFSRWSFDWITTALTVNTLYRIKAEAKSTDGKFASDEYINLTIGDMPKPPELTVEAPQDNITVNDYSGSTGLSISGTAWDPNWDSVQLALGKDVAEIKIIIKDASGSVVSTGSVKSTSGLKLNETSHSYTWSYKWSTRQIDTQNNFIYPNGVYSIEVSALDDSEPPLESGKITKKINLHHVLIPTAKIKDITVVENAKKIDYEYRDHDYTGIFKFESKKGVDEVKLQFDLSDSYDPDDVELAYYINYGEKGGTPLNWENKAISDYIYFGHASEKKIEKQFQVTIKVRDDDNAENEKLLDNDNQEIRNLTIIIEYIPEDPPPEGPLSPIVSLPLARDEVRIMFIILLIIFNIIAAAIIISKYKKINQRRRARDAAVDVSKQKQRDAEKKKKEDIYEHIQFEQEEGTGRVAVAGAAAASLVPQEDLTTTTAEQLAAPAEPEAPQLVSVEQPLFESAPTPATGPTLPETQPKPTAGDTTTQAPPAQPPVTPQPVHPAPAPVTPQPVQPTPAAPPVAPAPTAPTEPEQPTAQKQKQQQK